jgi:hypothetical protein
MRGGVTAVVTVLLLALVLPSAGAAQAPLPVGEADGVRLVRERGQLVVVFTPRAQRLWRRVAGKRVDVSCVEFIDLGTRSGGNLLRAPKRGRRIRTGDHSRVDYCRVWLPARRVRRGGERQRRERVLIVSIPFTQEGAVFLDEQLNAIGLFGILTISQLSAEDAGRKGYLTYAELIELAAEARPRARSLFVELASPSDTPPPEKVGYYSDGAQHAAAVVLSASGRRLFLEHNGDALHTNVAKYIFGDVD